MSEPTRPQLLGPSDACITFVKQFEGLSLREYPDAVGVPTIGYGHTLGVHRGEEITAQRAEQLLREDLEVAANAIRRLVTVNLTQGEFDALTSFIFNVGAYSFERSTLLKRLNQGDYDAAAQELLRWDHAGHRVLLGLERRRAAEKLMFTNG